MRRDPLFHFREVHISLHIPKAVTMTLMWSLTLSLLLAMIPGLSTLAVSPEIQQLLSAKDSAEKNAIILELVEEAKQIPVESNDYVNWVEGPVVESPAAILMDMDTGTILYEKNAQERNYPASITKIMTVLLAVENGSPEQEVVFSHEAVYSIEAGSAIAGMKEGEKIDLDTCLRLVMSQSANECAYAVAETIGGSYEAFIDMMNERAAQLGCVNTHFVNPHGLFDEEHYVCAYDMALIAQAAYSYPWFRELCNIPNYKRPLTELNPTDDWNIRNRHQMLHEDSAYYYNGITGGKTGFTDEARNTLVTYAERDGMKLVCVVLRTEGVRVYHATTALFDYGFGSFRHMGVEELVDLAVIRTIRSGVGATVPADTQPQDVFTAISLDNSILPVGVMGNLAHADFQYYGKQVGSAELVVTREFSQSLVQKEAEEGTEDTEEPGENSEEAQDSFWQAAQKSLQQIIREAGSRLSHMDLASGILIGVFAAAVILMIIALTSLRKMKRRGQDKAREHKKAQDDESGAKNQEREGE